MFDQVFDLGPYSGFIWPAYGISVLMLGGAAAWTLAAWRGAKRRLAALEDRHAPMEKS
jgi:heme exporter protein CcmD